MRQTSKVLSAEYNTELFPIQPTLFLKIYLFLYIFIYIHVTSCFKNTTERVSKSVFWEHAIHLFKDLLLDHGEQSNIVYLNKTS
jgi:hypothetical protein